MMFRALLLVVSVMFLAYCTKKEVPVPTSTSSNTYSKPDTIKPGAYFPVFPGSWWVYKITDTVSTRVDSVICSTSYKPFVYCLNDGTACTHWSDTIFVPYVRGGALFPVSDIQVGGIMYSGGVLNKAGPIIGYKQMPTVKFVYVGTGSPKEFLSEKPGPCNLRHDFTYWDCRTGCLIAFEEVYQNIYKKKVGLDSVLCTEGVFLNAGQINKGIKLVTYTEYKKDIGLSLKLTIDTVRHDTLMKMELLNYHIGP